MANTPTTLPILFTRHRALLVFALSAMLVAAGCTIGRNPVSESRRLYAWSWEKEQRIGAQSDEQIVAQFGLIENEELQAYVEEVGQRVLAKSDLRDPGTPEKFREAEFHFRVLAAPVVNAFALPGGYVYVTRGLLTHLQNEAQLAVVLGHEITHVAARHASAQAAKQQLARFGLFGGAILGQTVFGLPGGNILNIGSTASQLLFFEYSRDNEVEADVRGVEYAAKAGYEVGEAAAFFETLDRLQQQGPGLPTFLSTHPDPGNREQHILELAEQWEGRTQMTIVDQAQYYGVIEGLILGENPRLGFVEDGVFYHPELAFKFPVPSNFQVENQRSRVIIAAPQGRAALVFKQAAAEGSARAAAAEAIQQLRGQQGVAVVDQGRGSVAGYPSYSLLVEARTQQGEVRALFYFIEYGGAVWTFQGVAAAENFSAYEEAFLRTIRGFDRVTDQSILTIQPAELNIVTAEQAAPFRALAERYIESGELPTEMSLEELALLNQVHLDTVIEAGTPLKVPGR